MNIFTFSNDPWQSALWLDDVRKNKMILESCQLMSAAIRINDPFTDLEVYKTTHRGHPCTLWTKASRGNFGWLLAYTKALGEQKTGGHKSLGLMDSFDYYYKNGYFPADELQPFANCARNKSQGLDFTSIADTTQAYREYICERWARDTVSLSWKWGEEPSWR